jgi:soluble lytic murein transglycosylase-like protein
MVIVATVSATVVVAQASDRPGPARSEEVFKVARARIDSVDGAIKGMDQAQRSQAYAASIEQLQQQKEQERRNREATERFGQWGPELVEAAAMYGQDPAALYRVMSCESGGNPYADNGVNKGLFQFHPGTFAGTPYGSASIYDGHAQIFAAAWMWSQGRKGEWGCA